MTKRDELAAWLADLPEHVVDAWHAQAAQLRVTMAPQQGEASADDTQAWLDVAASDALAALDALEAGVPEGDKDAWLNAMWENATPVRYDETTGELVEVDR